jgi:hypothetical protein
MGAHPWFYFVEYQPDIEGALQNLRRREFQAGRYYPAMWFLNFPIELNLSPPGAQHDTIEKALIASDASGTQSILDMRKVSDTPELGAVTALPTEQSLALFGTTRPTHEMVDSSDELFELLDRGQGVYILVYENDEPAEIFFAGYSFD